jgi:hypothetical protein
MSPTKLMTAQDPWDLPEEDGCRFELVYGELKRMPGGSAIHGRTG